MKRPLISLVATGLAVWLALPAAAQPPPVVDPDDEVVTGHAYVRHDGGTDVGIAHCEDEATNPAPDDDPDDGDIDSNDGGGFRQNNEPYSVIDPTNPSLVVAGSNDYCLTDFQDAWEGFYFSTDGGETWTNSLVPGYRQDTSGRDWLRPCWATPRRGTRSPLSTTTAICSLEASRSTGSTPRTATCSSRPTSPIRPIGLGATRRSFRWTMRRTVIVGQGTPGVAGIFQDKPMLEVDRTGGDHDGNVYVCWSRFVGNGQNQIHFSRSTDTGAHFSKKTTVSKGKGLHSGQGCDIAVSADGTVHGIWRAIDDRGSKRANGIGYT